MVEWFDIDGIGRSAARFDFQKLESLNGHYIRAMAADQLLARLEAALPFLPGGEAFAAELTEGRRLQLLAALPHLKERAKTLNDLVAGAAFIFAERPLRLDEAAAALLDPPARAVLADVHATLGAATDWHHVNLEAALKDFAAGKGLKLGKVAQPLRAALTGKTTSPGIFDVLAILGRDESLARIADQIGS
jgi:glutamyl-tRNA synthetase